MAAAVGTVSYMSFSPNRLLLLLCALALVAAACGSQPVETALHDGGIGASPEEIAAAAAADEEAESGADAQNADSTVASSPAAERTDVILAADWSDGVTITFESEAVVVASDGLPDHEIADEYLGAEAATSYDAQFRFPLVPTASNNPAATPSGPIGVAVSGAVFFNPFESEDSDSAANDENETIDGVPFIDSCGGHPLANGSVYHYHGIPSCISNALDTPGQHSEIVGFLFDGYPVYGPQDLGGQSPIDLDSCNGHFGPTPDFAEDTYHYHVTAEANYISECFAGFAIATPVVGD